MAKWTGPNRPITREMSENEPIDQQLFGPSYDLHQQALAQRGQRDGINHATYRPWRGKPKIVRNRQGASTQ